MNKPNGLSLLTSDPDVIPTSPFTNSSAPSCPSPLASSSSKRKKNLTVETKGDYQTAVFDFSEFSKAMDSSGSPKNRGPIVKTAYSPQAFSPKSFVQRYDIFNTQHLSDPLVGGLAGWGNIQDNFLTQSIVSVQSVLAPYLLDTETRALVMFHPVSASIASIRNACQKFGILNYLKSNFHSKGVTFFSYFDIRSAISAQAKLDRYLSAEGIEVSVQFSIMLGADFNDCDAKLQLKNVGATITEAQIQSSFNKFGPLSSIQRKFMVSPESPTGDQEEPPSLCEFAIEYFNLQDGKKAVDKLTSSITKLFGAKATLQIVKPGQRSVKLLQTLTELLTNWKTALLAQGVDCNSPLAASGNLSPKSFPVKAKDEILSIETGSDENSDPSSPCPSPTNGNRTRYVAPDDQPLVERSQDATSIATSRLIRSSKYRETELGLVEVTPPSSPEKMKSVPDVRYSSEDIRYQAIQGAPPPADTFHSYRHHLLMEHQKLLKMQEALLVSMPSTEYYPPYPQQHHRGAGPPLRDEAMSYREMNTNRRRDYNPNSKVVIDERDYYRGGSERHSRGQYPEGDMYMGQQWSSGHGGYQSNRGYHQSAPDMRMQGHNSSGRWQPGRGGYRGEYIEYGHEYSPHQLEYDRPRGSLGPEYRRPAVSRNPSLGQQYPDNAVPGYSPHRGISSVQESDRRFDQQLWNEREQHETNKANVTFVVRVEDILSGFDNRVTIMVKNIPNKYSQAMLLDEINSIQSVSYDFFYLPMDFRNRCNVGYAFINFTDCNDVVVFFSHFHGRKWNHFNSEKVCAVTYARIQGKQSLMMRYQNSSLLDREESYKPLLFFSRGHPLEGQPEPFPTGPGNNGRVSGRGYSGPY